MKTHHLLAILTFCFVFSSCKKDKKQDSNNGPKGLVTFVSAPGWGSNELQFAASIQFAAPGVPTTIEYIVQEGTNVIQRGSALATNADAGLGLFFYTPTQRIPIPASTYSGKTIQIILDPDLKVTSPTYQTTDQAFWRTRTLMIP